MQDQIEGIKASCPECCCPPEKIVYKNSGPIVRLICPECGFVVNDFEARENGFSSMIDYWNHIGWYMVHDE